MKKIMLMFICAATIAACGSPDSSSATGTGGGSSASSSASSSAATGTGGSVPMVPFTVGDNTCSGVWHDTNPSKGTFGGVTIDDTGGVSALMAVPPSYPASYSTESFPIIYGVPLYFCLDKGSAPWVYFVSDKDNPNPHPDPARMRTGTVDLATLTWTKTAAGSSLAEATVTLDPPLLVNQGEAVYGGLALVANQDGYFCTRLCEDSDHDPNSWWSALDANGNADQCPSESCGLAHLYNFPTPKVASMYGLTKYRNVGMATGIAPASAMARRLPRANIAIADGPIWPGAMNSYVE